MVRKFLSSAFGMALLLASAFISTASSSDQPIVSRKIEQTLTSKYPSHKLVNACSGKFVGRANDAVAVLHNQAKKEFLVVWVTSQGAVQVLDSVTQTEPEFEIECMDAKEAKEREYDVHHTETIEGSLRVPKGLGAVCYFIDETTAKCWTLDHASGRLMEIGGWQT